MNGTSAARSIMGRDTRAACTERHTGSEAANVKCLLVTCGKAMFHRVIVEVRPGEEHATILAATMLFLHPRDGR